MASVACSFTAPESVVSVQMPSAASKFESEVSRLTDEVLAAIASAPEVGPSKTDRDAGVEAGPVAQIMAAASSWLSTDSVDARETRKIEARKAARGTILRAAYATVSPVWDRTEIARVFGVSKPRVSQVKRGLDRVAEYDALDIPAGDRWSVTDLEKGKDSEWQAHLADLTATDDDDAVTGNTDTDTAPDAAPAAPRAVTVADVLKSLDAARDALDSLTVAVDDTEAMEIASALAAVQYAAEAYAI